MKIDTDDPVDNVVRLRAESFPLEQGESRRRKGPMCMHHRVLVDSQMRITECKTCGAYIDPFEYLLGVARESDWLVAMRAEKKKVAVELQDTKDALTKLRSEVRRVRIRVHTQPMMTSEEEDTLWYRMLCVLWTEQRMPIVPIEKVRDVNKQAMQAAAKAVFELGARSERERMEGRR